MIRLIQLNFVLVTFLLLVGVIIAQDPNAALTDLGDTPRDLFVPVDTDSSGQVIVLHPELEPSPALKYQLLPDFTETRPGNAAVFYGKVMAEQTNFFHNHELQSSIIKLANAPLSEVKVSEIAATAIPEGSYHQLRLAALCESCDWQVPIRYERPTWEILLPELQQTRHFARLLAVRARYQIAHGKFDAAIETLQTGYALARNDATGPTYVHFLVAVAVKGIMDDQLMCLIQQPGAPNMYWALAALPEQFLDLRKSTTIEKNFVVLSYPELMDLSVESTAKISDKQWHELLVDVLELSILAADGNFDVPESRKKALVAAETAVNEKSADARQYLLEAGIPAQITGKMSNSQVVLMAGMDEYHRFNQEIIKWSFLPYHQAIDGIAAAEEHIAQVDGKRILNLAATISPSLRTVFTAGTRTMRKTSLLMVIEAVRMHAAKNAGRLPENLNFDLKTPTPRDPVSGQPFVYEFKQDHATVTGPDLPASPMNVKIEIRKN